MKRWLDKNGRALDLGDRVRLADSRVGAVVVRHTERDGERVKVQLPGGGKPTSKLARTVEWVEPTLVTDVPEERAEEVERQRQVVVRNRAVPYEAMREFKELLEKRFPGAEVVPRWYSGRVYAEVWQDRRAKLYFQT